jgi:hypothetical protein
MSTYIVIEYRMRKPAIGPFTSDDAQAFIASLKDPRGMHVIKVNPPLTGHYHGFMDAGWAPSRVEDCLNVTCINITERARRENPAPDITDTFPGGTD